jgi:hypothetical protein
MVGVRCVSVCRVSVCLCVRVSKCLCVRVWSTLNKEFLDSHDWLGKPENRILFELNEVPWDEPCIRSTVSLPFA